jgi:hypothetical protein
MLTSGCIYLQPYAHPIVQIKVNGNKFVGWLNDRLVQP